MEAQLEHVHVAYTFFARLVPICNARSVIISNISASELSRKFVESALLVGWCREEKSSLIKYMPPPPKKKSRSDCT